MLRNHTASILPARRALILVVAHEDILQAGLVADEVDERILGRDLDDRVDPALRREAKRPPVGRRLYPSHAIQPAERVGRRHGGEGQLSLVTLDVLHLCHAADARQAPLADDSYSVA